MSDTEKDLNKDSKPERVRKVKEYDEPVVCWSCGGSGVIERYDTVDQMCSMCDGEGVIWQ